MHPQSIIDWFWSRIDKTSSPHGCWLWIGARTKAGYGRVRNRYTHRFMWELTHNCQLTSAEYVLHNCPGGDNPSCVNPQHLWRGTQRDNVADMWAKGRAWTPPLAFLIMCRKGLHQMTPENAPMRKTGRRTCRACARAKAREYGRGYRERHREHLREYLRAWHAAHRTVHDSPSQ